MNLRQCEICKCYLTDGEVNASIYDRYATCFQHMQKPFNEKENELIKQAIRSSEK